MSEELRRLVFDSQANAEENGYDFAGWTAEQIAVDMLDCDATFEGRTVDEVLPYVEEWRAQRMRRLVG